MGKISKITCLECGDAFSINRNFFTLNTTSNEISKKHKQYEKIGYVPVCKKCLRKMCFEEDGVTPNRAGIMKALKWLDLPFDENVYKDMIQDGGFDLGNYSRNIKIKFKKKEISFESTNDINKKKKDEQPEIFNFDEESDFQVTKQIVFFWGKNLSKDDYEFLENEYRRLLNSYEHEGYAMELLFQEASHQRLIIKKKRENRESVDKELKTLQDLLGSANVKPVQETGSQATDQETFGTLIKKYENERPIPEPLPEWKDVDRIIWYISVWFLGHLCKMLGIKNDYAYMYEEEVRKHTVEAPTYNDEDFDESEVETFEGVQPPDEDEIDSNGKDGVL